MQEGLGVVTRFLACTGSRISGRLRSYFGYFYVMESPQTTVRLTRGDKSVRVGLDDLEVRYEAILSYSRNAVVCFVLGSETLQFFNCMLRAFTLLMNLTTWQSSPTRYLDVSTKSW